jgi:nucleotide-binding universal stress UspA family protein
VTSPTIVVAIDASDTARLVLSVAAELSSRCRAAELHVIHVVEGLQMSAIAIGGSPLSQPHVAVLVHEAIEDVRARIAELDGRAGCPVSGHVAAGAPWREVVRFAAAKKADYLVIGTHDERRLRKLLLGSVAQTILQRASCPVIIARPKVDLVDEAHSSHEVEEHEGRVSYRVLKDE